MIESKLQHVQQQIKSLDSSYDVHESCHQDRVPVVVFFCMLTNCICQSVQLVGRGLSLMKLTFQA